MKSASIAFPDEAAYQFRYSLLLRDSGLEDEALDHARKAVELNNNYFDAILHLASMEVKRDLSIAKDLINKLPARLTYNQKLIKSTVEVEIAIRERRFEEARIIINNYKDKIDSYVMDVRARIEYNDAYYDYTNGKLILAKDKVIKAEEIINDALKNFPSSEALQTTLLKIKQLKLLLKI